MFEEGESVALARWLSEREDTPKISSEISTIEVIRTCRRRDDDSVAAGRQVLAGLDLVPLATDLVEQAAVVGPSALRTLDAIHLASALAIGGDLTAFVVYDTRLKAAADDAGLPIAAPG